MDVLLIDIDSKIPNLALKKIEAYHLSKGDTIHWNMPVMRHAVDKIYASCIFTKNKPEADEWAEYGAEVGGTGYDLHKTLPPEIEAMPLRINWGFTTRGCIRQCPFCFVPEKEGLIHAVGDLYDVWDGKSKDVVLMDNNILALPKHFELICQQLIKEKVRVDFNQGLDHRLLNEHNVQLLKSIRHKEYHFAFDNIADMDSVGRGISLLNGVGINRSIWYILVGFNSTFEQDMERIMFLRERNQNGYVMRYDGCETKHEYIELARWVNQHHIFQGLTWEQFTDKRGIDI
jgi:hypothetical protein